MIPRQSGCPAATRARIRRPITRNALVFIASLSRNSLVRGTSFQDKELTLAIEQLRLRPPESLLAHPGPAR